MLKLLLPLTLLIIVSIPGKALGENAPQKVPQRAVLEYDGVPGFWFERDYALRILADLRELAERREEITILEEIIEMRSSQVTVLREMVQLEREAANLARTAFESCTESLDALREERDVWWRSPVFWLSMGVVVTIVLEVAAVVSLFFLTS